MQEMPSQEDLREKVMALFKETLPDKPLDPQKALIAELGFDSLDLIEASFCLEETFGFEFADDDPIELLNKELGGDMLIQGGKLTELGLKVTKERMPELGEIPQQISVHELSHYFSVDTFVRLLSDFYQSIPDQFEGEPVTIRNFKAETEGSQKPVPAAKGSLLVAQWVEEKRKALAVS